MMRDCLDVNNDDETHTMDAQAQVWDRSAIVELLMKSEAAVVRAIKTLYARQTADEQAANDTKHTNGRGFNSNDARFLSDIAKALPRWNDRMTARQLVVARRLLPKYARQLLEEVEAKGGQVDYGPARKSRKSEIVVSLPAAEPALASNWGRF